MSQKLGLFKTDSRSPASIPPDVLKQEIVDFDESLLAGASDALLKEAKLLEEQNKYGLSLGSFLSKNEMGENVLACKVYDKIVLHFVAEDMAIDGKSPKMEVETSCELAANNPKALRTIWIPHRKLMGENLNISEVSYFEGGLTTFRFTDVFAEWPTQWSLQSVRIYNSKESAKQMNFERADLDSLLSKQIRLYWQ